MSVGHRHNTGAKPPAVVESPSRIAVLMYHRVDDAKSDGESRYAVEPERFAAHMHALAQAGYRAIRIDDLTGWLEGRLPGLPEKSFVLTFDDGFLGVHDHAWPILRELNWPFTVFLVSDLIGKTDEWTRKENPGRMGHPLMSVDHIGAMQANGVSFHSHTRHHASLTSLDDETLADELAGSRKILGEVLGIPAHFLAYPYGHVDERVEKAVRAAGYQAAFSTQPGFNRADVNPFRIRRLDVYGTDTAAALVRKIKLGSNEGGLSPILRYYWNRALAKLGRKAA
ncbi:polysaccharide deacetylase family protein [Methylococcus sp. EFPC2]|uniref:polysaccharide deacetylase family protein n=1 Tax=Methylococcus sp. EFPC2 TaxID=2812648 RepID=UPI001967890E|nr:polysaccharide deacetylase family protein [Methylococcus sp. EFPC2]QSA98002.1 polysaccharide deacetylase family protein [Methylococcus sp. EFPC2]